MPRENKTRQLYTRTVRFHHSISEDISDEYVLHTHPDYEAYFFISGNVSYLVEGIEYQPEPYSLILIGANAAHGFRVNSALPYERYSFHFLPELLSGKNREMLLSPFHQGPFYFSRLNGFQLESYFESIISCCDMDSELKSIALPARMESLLSQILFIQKQTRELPEKRLPRGHSAQNLLTYIHDHIQEPLSLEELSALFFIGKNQLNRSFRALTGTTITHYINQTRVSIARQYILEGQSPSVAAQRSGFQDYSNFYRAYKRIHGFAPTETVK